MMCLSEHLYFLEVWEKRMEGALLKNCQSEESTLPLNLDPPFQLDRTELIKPK